MEYLYLLHVILCVYREVRSNGKFLKTSAKISDNIGFYYKPILFICNITNV